VPPGSVAALAEALDQAIREPRRGLAWTTAARRRVETDLSFETRMAKVEAIYTELMAMRPAETQSTDLPVSA
jgi:glycosyltransferase involved in cell wall biosynthesis